MWKHGVQAIFQWIVGNVLIPIFLPTYLHNLTTCLPTLVGTRLDKQFECEVSK
jgi:hypothetical protein